MLTILSTKKLSEKSKVKLENAGFLVVETNFITTKTIRFSIEKTNENLIFTSKNAVKSILPFKSELENKNVFCVGSKTKAYLEKKGFNMIFFADNAQDLANKICKDYNTLNFTFFCGNIRKETLPNILNENKIELNEIVVYKTKLKSHKISIQTDAILFFSPSAIKSYLKENTIKGQVCFCIGKTTAESLENITENIEVTKNPSRNAVIKKCIKYYKNKND